MFCVSDFEDERLAHAEQQIVAGECRMTRLSSLIEQLAQNGGDTARAEALLHRFADILDAWQSRRVLISTEK